MAELSARAVAWASETLGADVTDVAQLPGGITSTMLLLTDGTGRRSVLRLLTNEPWRSQGPELCARERAALTELAATPVPAPTTLGLDADGTDAGVAAHLMSHLPGRPTTDEPHVEAMAAMLAAIHAVTPAEPFRDFESWSYEAKWLVPGWSRHPDSWRATFELLAAGPPAYEPTFLHRDYSHRNLLWDGPRITGVVDWVEASTGPVWLDAAHAATNLAMAHGPAPARAFLAAYAERAAEPSEAYWLVLDAVGFLPPPGRPPMFGDAGQLERLDEWLHELVSGH